MQEAQRGKKKKEDEEDITAESKRKRGILPRAPGGRGRNGLSASAYQVGRRGNHFSETGDCSWVRFLALVKRHESSLAPRLCLGSHSIGFFFL